MNENGEIENMNYSNNLKNGNIQGNYQKKILQTYLMKQREKLLYLCSCNCCEQLYKNNKNWKDDKMIICENCYEIKKNKHEYTPTKIIFNLVKGLARTSFLPPDYIKDLQNSTDVFCDLNDKELKNVIKTSEIIHSEDIFGIPYYAKKEMLNFTNNNTEEEKEEKKRLREFEMNYERFLNEELKCTLCCEVYCNNLFIMDCDHKVCLKCAKTLQKVKNWKKKIECPYCKVITKEKKKNIKNDIYNDLWRAILKCGILPLHIINKYQHTSEKDNYLQRGQIYTENQKEYEYSKMKFLSFMITPQTEWN